MKKIVSIVLALCALLAVLPMSGAVSAATDIKNNGIAALDITVNKDISYLHKSKDNLATEGTVIMYDAAGKELHRIGIKQFKGRGNASWNLAKDKKSYNMKLSEKTALIDGAGKAVDWCLIANNVHNDLWESSSLIHSNDRTGLGNMMAMTLYQQMNGDAALQYQSVDLYLNGEYRGTYLLTEKVEIHSKRVDITKPVMTDGKTRRLVSSNTSNKSSMEADILRSGIQSFQYVSDSKVTTHGGFIIEADSRYKTNNEASWFVTRQGASFVIKQPECINLQQMARIAIYVQELEDALFSSSGYNTRGKYYTEYLDIQSLAKRYLLDCFTGQFDIFKTSSYFYIDGDANSLVGKMKTGPAWDYDFPILDETDLYHYAAYRLEGQEWRIGARMWTEPLLTHGDFVDELYRLNKNTFLGLVEKMNNSGLKAMRNEIAASQAENDKLWKNNFADMADKFISDFNGRYQRWRNTLWSQNLLMGVTVTAKGGTLYANVNGTAQGYRWYSIDESGSLTAINGITSASFTPTSPGKYCVRVNGSPIGAGKTLDGARAGSVMYSNAVTTGCTHSNLKTLAGIAPTCTETGLQQCWQCGSCGQMFSDKACTEAVNYQPEIPATGSHKWDKGAVTVAATKDTEGVRTYTCTDCDTTRTEPIPRGNTEPVTPTTTQPSTGTTDEQQSGGNGSGNANGNGNESGNGPASNNTDGNTVNNDSTWTAVICVAAALVVCGVLMPIIALIIRRRRIAREKALEEISDEQENAPDGVDE